MRHIHTAIVLLVSFAAIAFAWSAEDHEIFRLRDEVALHEGDNATFYSFVGVKPTATIDEINKAYRKSSRAMHPDKARQSWVAAYDRPSKPSSKPGSKPTVHVHKNKKPSQKEINAFNKEASARFARLGIVTNILRGEERERYDHFLNNGFPKWRGTGYYYQRYRPGLGAVLTGLFIVVGGGAHYLALYLSWKRQREFVERYIKHARRTAWGDESSISSIPGLSANNSAAPTPPPQSEAEEEQEQQAMNWNRREKRAMAKEKAREDRKVTKNPKAAAKAAEKAKSEGISTPQEAEITSGPVGAKKRTVAENGKVLIVDSTGNVFLEEETEEGDVHEYLLDPNEILQPTIYDTVLFRLPKFVYGQTAGRFMDKPVSDDEIAELITTEETREDEQALKAALPTNKNAEARRRKAKAKR